jgi:transposase-like protein
MTASPASPNPIMGIAMQNVPAPSPSAQSALADLPPPDTRRWVVSRKAQVVAAVRDGALSLEDACRRYDLSAEEFKSWERALSAYGLRGLQTTRLGQYRAKPVQAAAP